MPSIRAYKRSDLDSVANVFATAWRRGFHGLIPDNALNVDPVRWAANVSEQLSTEFVLVAEKDDHIVGFAWLRNPAGYGETSNVAELHALYSLPGEHAGMALLSEAVERLEPRYSAMTLWSLDTNRAALNFYQARGFRPDGATRDVERFGCSLPHSRLWRPLTFGRDTQRRPAIRVIARRPDNAVLMMEHRNPALAEPAIWLAPGGKPEGEESAEQTARREFAEETGRRLTEPLRHIWKRRHIWDEDGELVESVESFFLVDVPDFEPTAEGFTAREKAVVTRFKWWSRSELENTDEVVVPRILRSSPRFEPSRPIWVGV